MEIVRLEDREALVRHRGALDPDHGNPSLDARRARAALDAILAGRAPEPAETDPVGCSVKWREA